MGLFHNTLKDAEDLFDKNKEVAIKILRKHQLEARKLNASINAELLDYYDGLGGICGALEKNNIAQAHIWLKGQQKSLKEMKKQLENLKKAIE